ncbi:ABC transporter substrate-binding protein [Pendulispora brunnea]|uniref:ABC transporter substrate-binding protein n=1 Tax=Pendulispora brunnea TaxID=2905690 RepID=A0ABZ2KKR7_9BACT
MSFITLTVSSCVALLGQNTTQCDSTADCTARGPDFASTVCNSDHLCQAITDETRCDTSATCMARYGADAPHVCDKQTHRCVKLTSEDCTTPLADSSDYANDSTIYLGLMMPMTGTQASAAAPIINAVDLARKDFKLNSNTGLPPAKEGGPRRPLAFIVCDEQVSFMRAAHHLIDDVHVPAIIGPSFSSNVAKLSTDYAAGADVLLMGPTGGAALITTLDVRPKGKRLVWRTVPSDTEHARTHAALVPVIEKQLRDAGVIAANEAMKVALLHRGDNFGKGLASTVFDNMRFNNGKTAAENLADEKYADVDYGDPSTDPNPDTGYAKAITRLKDFAPHIILAGGADEISQKILGPTESNWTATYRPRWLNITGATLTGNLLATVNAQPASKGLRTRIVATAAGRTGPLYSKFTILYQGANEGATPSFYAAGGYDATYLLAYSIVALGDQPLTGTALATGLERLIPPAPVVATGADSISKAFDALTRNQSIDYDGAMGAHDFNPAVGEATNDIQIICIGADDSGRAANFRPSGAFYRNGVITGTVACP